MKNRCVFLASCAISIAVAQLAFGQATTNNLVFIENSPTDLSATYLSATSNELPLSVTGAPDEWLVSTPSNIILNVHDRLPPSGTFSTIGFIEPENPALFNWIVQATETSDFFVTSDLVLADFVNDPAVGPFIKLSSDGATVGPVGIDTNNRLSISLTFRDMAARNEAVPDNASTFGLLSLALAALVGVSRLRSTRLA